jgi:hypothetical protein
MITNFAAQPGVADVAIPVAVRSKVSVARRAAIMARVRSAFFGVAWLVLCSSAVIAALAAFAGRMRF